MSGVLRIRRRPPNLGLTFNQSRLKSSSNYASENLCAHSVCERNRSICRVPLYTSFSTVRTTVEHGL